MNFLSEIFDSTTTQAMNTMTNLTSEIADNATTISSFGDSYFEENVSATDDISQTSPNIISNRKLYWEFYLGLDIMAYMIPVKVTLGIVGNLLVFATLIQKRPMTSTTMYLLNLSLADFTVIFLGPLARTVPQTLWGYDIIQNNVLICRNWWFFASTAMNVSGWTLMTITLERVYIVFKPLKAKNICTVKTARCALIIIYLLCTVSSSHIYWTYGPRTVEKGNGTVTTAGCVLQKDTPFLKYYITTIRPWQDFVIRSAIPFTTLLTCNLLIIYKLTEAKRNRSDLYKYAKKEEGFLSLAIMLLVVSFTHLVCITPLQILYFIDKIGPFAKPLSSHAQSVAAIRWSIAINLFDLNYAVNFILYSISGKQFREDFMQNVWKKIWCKCCERMKPRSQSTAIERY